MLYSPSMLVGGRVPAWNNLANSGGSYGDTKQSVGQRHAPGKLLPFETCITSRWRMPFRGHGLAVPFRRRVAGSLCVVFETLVQLIPANTLAMGHRPNIFFDMLAEGPSFQLSRVY